VASEPAEPPALEAVIRVWEDLLAEVGATLGYRLGRVRPTGVEAPDRVVVGIPSRYNDLADSLDTPEARGRIDAALASLLGRPARVAFVRGAGGEESEPAAAGPSAAERADELASDPLVKTVAELFEARKIRVDFEDEPGGG
jgi:hypothetical protein